MTFKRRYDIGANTVIEDDGHHVTAIVSSDDGGGIRSKGCPRPFPNGEWPEDFQAVISKCGRLFYLQSVTGIDGFWMTKDTFAEAAHIPGKGWDYAQFTFASGRPEYFRGILPFWCWDVRASTERQACKKTDPHVADFLKLIGERRKRDEKEFDDFIGHTGRSLAWIMERIGGWEPAPKLPEPIPLTD